ncbi:MAG: HEPN domain-containing protein [Bdellovibrionales bacterium]|nr:HEPN domain-containing protein [Bdellovibrionales bacterium]
MKTKSLEQDYIDRAEIRLGAVKYLYSKKAWADVVRESQEIVELALIAILRRCHIEVPRIHDVSNILIQEKSKLPEPINERLEKLADISRQLRRDREFAYYGSEDLTPSEFYNQKDAKLAFSSAIYVVESLGLF